MRLDPRIALMRLEMFKAKMQYKAMVIRLSIAFWLIMLIARIFFPPEYYHEFKNRRPKQGNHND